MNRQKLLIGDNSVLPKAYCAICSWMKTSISLHGSKDLTIFVIQRERKDLFNRILTAENVSRETINPAFMQCLCSLKSVL